MRIIRTTFLFILIGAGLTSFAQPPSTPIEFNNYIVSITDTLQIKGGIWGKALLTADSTGNYSILKDYRNDMENFIDGKIGELDAMADMSGSRNLQKKMIGFLEYEKKMIEKTFAPFEKLDAFSPQWKLDELNDALTKLADDEDKELKVIAKAQDDYALKNGFIIHRDDE